MHVFKKYTHEVFFSHKSGLLSYTARSNHGKVLWKSVPNWVINAVHDCKIIKRCVIIDVMAIPFIKGINANGLG